MSSGLAIRTTQNNTVLVKDVRPGGAIEKDGFIKVQNRSQLAHCYEYCFLSSCSLDLRLFKWIISGSEESLIMTQHER